jgi:hypothetical protein
MPQVEIDDHVFKAAQRRASDGGYSSVDEYVADIVDLLGDSGEEIPNLDKLFTPRLIAEIDRAAAEVEAGNFHTADEVKEHFKRKREARFPHGSKLAGEVDVSL